MAGPFAFARDVTFGRLVGVDLPGDGDHAGLDALAAGLAAEEQALARALAPARRATWLGGRVALRAALADLGLAASPILATPRGGPALPAGVAGSIAHKHSIAVALAARAADGVTLGVDVEIDRPPRVDISGRVLTPAERLRVEALAEAERWRAVLAAFAAKEAIYKALDPWLGRDVSFQEVEVDVDAATARLAPRPGEPAFEIEVCVEPLPGHLLVTARVQRRAG